MKTRCKIAPCYFGKICGFLLTTVFEVIPKMPVLCPICGLECQDEAGVAMHMVMVCAPVHDGLMTCICGVPLLGLARDNPAFRENIDNGTINVITNFLALHWQKSGGMTRHWNDHLMGVKDG